MYHKCLMKKALPGVESCRVGKEEKTGKFSVQIGCTRAETVVLCSWLKFQLFLIMAEKHTLMLNNSILYRCSSKFCTKELEKYDLNVTPLLTLIAIHENEGIGMQELAKTGSYDKGTVTKVIQKLEEQGYVRIEENPENRREKKLYTTEKLRQIIGDIYMKRQEWWEKLTRGMSNEEIETFERLSEKVAVNARNYAEEMPSGIRIFGLQKLTLLDFPGRTGATVFVGGCNLRCPFCHNRDLVFLNENAVPIPEEDVMDYLEKRKNLLDGVCVSGGEPLLQAGLEDFFRKVKDLGYRTKLDTNGILHEKLKDLVEKGLIDYVAMDVKNCLAKYGETSGIPDFSVDSVKKSIAYLKEGHVDYEFRTTVVKEFHTEEDMEEIGKLLEGAKAYYLQKFRDHGSCIREGLHAPEDEELDKYLRIVQKYIPNAGLR